MKTNPQKVIARKMMTQKEISKHISPFDSAWWRHRKAAIAKREAAKRK